MSQAGEVNVASTPGVIDFIEGNMGGPVPPDAGNVIHLVGSGDISVTGNPGTNTLTISATGLPTWNKIATSQPLVANMGYICTGGGVLSLSLPATSNVGDIIEVTLDGSAGWIITQGAGQSIRIGNDATTAGVGGSLTSTQQGDSFRAVCSVTNLRWNFLSSMGNPIVV
jgi:hypothetical protein